MSVAIVLASENNNYTRKSHLSKFYLSDRRGQFNKTFTRVIYKCSYCSQTLKQWLHL